MLQELPESLDETYERVLREINKKNREHAHRLLQCLTVAVRPLRIAELSEILAVDFGSTTGGGTSRLNPDWRWEDQEQAVLSTCSSLIAVVDEDGSQIVQFSHFSVKEFLTSSRLADSSGDVSRFHIDLGRAHTIIAKACLGTLLRLPVDGQDNEFGVEDRFPLAKYAAEHWVDHAQFESVVSQIQETMEILFDPDRPYFSAWIQIHDIDTRPSQSSTFWHFFVDKKSFAGPLYYAALCGFHDLVEHLIDNYSQQVNARGGFYVSPLVAALAKGHLEIAELLYQHHADIDPKGHYNRTPLVAASICEHLEIIQWLLHRGVDPNARDEYGSTLQHLAAAGGYAKVVQTLLQHKADKNIQDSEGRTPLHRASSRGCLNVVRLLLEHGVDVNARSKDGSAALHLASRQGELEVARLLIEHGADVGARNNEGRTPSQVARLSDMAKLLSGHGSSEGM
jgi:ankyrin repeat protein